mmetsp:Transcript_27305/g.47110  ORF Transcript_27305/g.47110 Transcript_27305/m.47110 type:complete len:216 (-) Transcript_27305:359-1006(-)
MRSSFICSNLDRSSASRSAFFWARPTNSGRSPPTFCPFMASAAFLALSGLSKLTKPNPREAPVSSFMTMELVMSPNSWNIARSLSSSTSKFKFFTKTFVKFLSACPVLRFIRRTNGPTKTCLPFRSMPLTFCTARSAASWVSKCTNPCPLLWPVDSSTATLHERMAPKAMKVSYKALWSMDLSRFFTKTFPVPLLRRLGSLCDHMIRHGFPRMFV